MERTDSESDLLEYEQDQFLEAIARSTIRSTKSSGRQTIPTSGSTFLRQFMRAATPVDCLSIPVTTGKIEPKMGSVFPSVVSPVSRRPTVDKPDFISRPSPSLRGFGTTLSTTPERAQSLDAVNGGVSEGESDLVKRLRAVGNYIGGTYPENEDGREQRVSPHYSPGDFHYFSHPQNQSSSSAVPDRFRPGRESESVIQNITIRGSKRPKARSSDVAYQRRSSLSPAIPRVEIGLLPGVEMDHLPPSYNTIMFEGVGANSQVTTGWSNQTPRIPIQDASIPIIHPNSRGGNEPNGRQNNGRVGAGFSSDIHNLFEINLIFEGQLVRHRVSLSLTVAQLGVEAASIFRLQTQGLVLVLLGLVSHTLQPLSTLYGPPPMLPGSTVMIFQAGGQDQITGLRGLRVQQCKRCSCSKHRPPIFRVDPSSCRTLNCQSLTAPHEAGNHGINLL